MQPFTTAHVINNSFRRLPLWRPISITCGIAAARFWLLLGPHFATAFSSSAASSLSLPSRSYPWRSDSLRRRSPLVVSFSAPFAAPAGRNRSFRLMSSSSAMNDTRGPPTKWSDILTATAGNQNQWRDHANNLFPPLTSSSHKGSHGRVAIFGGSEKYTGAPYYAARSALHCGVDLATVFCANEAAVPIKCYSPELMVQGVYSVEEFDRLAKEEEGLLKELEECKQNNNVITHEMNEVELAATMEKLEHSQEKQNLLIQSELKNDDKMEVLVERLAKMKQLEEKLQTLRERQGISVKSTVDVITSMFPTLHALCIGPGLGRHPLVFKAAEVVIQRAMESNLFLVLDADALFMLSLKDYRRLLGQLLAYEYCVMTPNLMEMRRLDSAISEGTNGGKIAEGHRNIIVRKGNEDRISQNGMTMQCTEEGGMKRSGGIGDVLAGTISAFVAWSAISAKASEDGVDGGAANGRHRQQAFASWAACCAVKKGTRAAFCKKRRAMSALDVMEEIGEVIGGMEEKLALAPTLQNAAP